MNRALIHDSYKKAYSNLLDVYRDNQNQDMRTMMKKMALFGVKIVNTTPEPEELTYEEAEYNFQYADLVRAAMANLTPVEFKTVFPITKDLKGGRWGTKDYFFTRDYIKGLSQDEPIGNEIDSFLWNYTNIEITCYMVNLMGYASDLRQLQGLPSITEEWAAENGLTTYTMCKDQKGREFLVNNETGKISRVRKRRPRYLKVLKKEAQ